jgi:hypothetical protein
MALVRADQTPSNPVKAPAADVPSTILRDGWKRPLIVTPSGQVEAYTRASTIGGVLEDQGGIAIWKMRNAMWAIGHNRALRIRAAAIPDTASSENKDLLKGLGSDALDFADTRAAADVGTALHALTERVDQGLPIPDLEEEQAAIDAYIEATRGRFAFHGTEQFVVCDEHQVAGTFDRIAAPLGDMETPGGTTIPAGSRMVWDLKTAASWRFFGIKFAAQLAAYANGQRYRGWHTLGDVDPRSCSTDERKAASRGERLDWPDGIAPRTDWALILHVPQGGPEKEGDPAAQLYWVDLTLGRELLELACVIQGWRKRKDLVVPADPPRVPRVDEAQGRIAAAGTLHELETVWREYRDVWNDLLTARAGRRKLELAGVKGLGRA